MVPGLLFIGQLKPLPKPATFVSAMEKTEGQRGRVPCPRMHNTTAKPRPPSLAAPASRAQPLGPSCAPWLQPLPDISSRAPRTRPPPHTLPFRAIRATCMSYLSISRSPMPSAKCFSYRGQSLKYSRVPWCRALGLSASHDTCTFQ